MILVAHEDAVAARTLATLLSPLARVVTVTDTERAVRRLSRGVDLVVVAVGGARLDVDAIRIAAEGLATKPHVIAVLAQGATPEEGEAGLIPVEVDVLAATIAQHFSTVATGDGRPTPDAILAAILDGCVDGVAVLAADRRADDLWLVDVNPAGAALLGLPRERLVGKRLSDFAARDRASRASEKYRRVLETGEPLDEAAGQPLGCGSTAWARHRATAVDGLIVVWFSRRGARPRVEQPEHDDDDRVRTALLGAGHTLWEWSSDDGELHDARRFWPRPDGHPDKEIVGPLDTGRVAAAFAQHISGQTEEIVVEYRVGMTTGPWRWVADRGCVTERDDEGRPLRALGTRTDVTSRHRSEAELAALHRVSAEVAEGVPPRRLFGTIAQAAAEALDVEIGVVVRREDAGWRVIGTFGEAAPQVGAVLGSADGDVHSLAGVVPLSSWVDSPAGPAGSRPWGLVAAGDRRIDAVPPEAPSVLRGLAESMELALANARARAALVSQATTDALTGLVNHRVFHERLRSEVARARRHGDPVSLVLLDLDHFKRVNDRHGHAAGDEVLRSVAVALRAHAREGDSVARVGGEELAWLLPRADVSAALAAADRLRLAIAATQIAPVGSVTASMGVCDLASAKDAESLYERTDLALYWAKSAGRNRCSTYSDEVAETLLAQRAEAAVTLSPNLRSIRTLAWTVDARDAFTQGRSERIAEIATLVAHELGWAPEQVEALREAALVHDVGMVAVPDEVLTRAGPLTAQERQLMQTHVSVGARILADVLTPEQARWVRHHHERHDGSGYPDGLSGESIPAGSRLIAVADTWDAMISGRLHRRRRSHAEALAELRQSASGHFNPRAIGALESLFRRGALPGTAAIGDTPTPKGYLNG